MLQRNSSLILFSLLIGLVSLVALFAGCSSGGSLWMPTPQQLAEGGVLVKDANMGSLAKGRTILITDCSECHRTFWPHEYSEEEWPKILRSMGRRMSLSVSQKQDMEEYMNAALQMINNENRSGGLK